MGSLSWRWSRPTLGLPSVRKPDLLIHSGVGHPDTGFTVIRTHSRCTVLGHQRYTTDVRQTAVSPDGATIVCVCDDATLWLWSRVWVALVWGW